MLAEVDEAHETLSGTATQKILYRAFHEFGECAYARLAQLSVAHLYNLRKTGTYRKRRVVYQGTRPTAVSIGERRKPDPQGGPGISTALFRPAAPLLSVRSRGFHLAPAQHLHLRRRQLPRAFGVAHFAC